MITESYVIRAAPARLSFAELWRCRWMFLNLVRSSALLPYSETKFGYFWTMLRPFIFLSVMVLIKQRSGGVMGENFAYPLFLYTGLVLWWYLVDSVKASARSPFLYKGLITKIYYPRVITPAIPVLGRLFDLLIQAVGILVMMLIFDHYPDSNILLLPVAVFNILLLSLGLGYLFSILVVAFRDTERILDYILYIGIFLSPVLYAPTIIPSEYRTLYIWINPTVGPLSAFRAALFSGVEFDNVSLIASLITSTVLFIIGTVWFQIVQHHFPEKV